MTAWSRREREAAKALGGVRVVRHRGQRAPDVAPITLPTGEVLQPEVKHRKRLPRLLAAALTQALGYTPGAVPVAVVSEHRGAALAVLMSHRLKQVGAAKVIARYFEDDHPPTYGADLPRAYAVHESKPPAWGELGTLPGELVEDEEKTPRKTGAK